MNLQNTVLDITRDGDRCTIGALIDEIVYFWKEHGSFPTAIVLTHGQYRRLLETSPEPSTFLGISLAVCEHEERARHRTRKRTPATHPPRPKD